MRKLLDLLSFGTWLLLLVAIVVALPFLIVGSIGFLLRTLPRASVDWGNLLVGGIALVLFTAGVHCIGRGWCQKAREENDSSPRAWCMSWSAGIVAVLAASFAAAVCMVGSIHQVGWLLNDPDPFYGSALEGSGGGSINNLRGIGLDVMNYTSVYGRLPPGGTFTPDGAMLHSWETSILPFVAYDTRGINLDHPWNHPDNQKYFQCVLSEFINPDFRTSELADRDGYGLSHYAANSHVMGGNRQMKQADITDGTSMTLLIGEVNTAFKPWGHPANFRDPANGINTTPHGFGGARGSGGTQFVMADGSVRFVSDQISPEVLKALSTPAGGETIDEGVLDPAR